MAGFYLMHRGWRDNPALKDTFSRGDAWVWLIEAATFKPSKVGIAGKTITLQRGQLSHSLRFMADKWDWDEAKVRRFLSRLQRDEMIRCVTDAGQTVITICNYDKYQVVECVADAPTDAASTRHRRGDDAKKKEGNEGNKRKPHPLSGGASRFEEFWTAYPHRGKLPDPKKPACEKFERKVRDGIDPETIIEGAKRYAELVRSEMIEDRFVTTALVWLNQERWEAAKVEEPITAEEQAALDAARKGKPVIRVVAENLSADDDMPDIPEFLRRA